MLSYFFTDSGFYFLFMAYSFTKENENLVYKTFGTLLEFYKEIRESFILEVINFRQPEVRGTNLIPY